MGLFRFYLHQGKLITPSVCQTDAGFFVDQGPVTVTSVKDLNKVKHAIVKAFRTGNKVVPTPDGSEGAGSIILERLAIDSWTKFEKDAVLFTVHEGGRYITVHVTGKKDDGMWVPDESLTRKFDSRALRDAIADAIVDGIVKAMLPKPEIPKPMLMLPRIGA
jgi:hypothetical protein